MQENTIKVKSPEYGLVTFSMMTVRQMQVLREYEKLITKNEKNNTKNKTNIKSKGRTSGLRGKV